MQLKTVYSEFLFDCEVKHFSPRTIKGYKNNLQRFFNYLEDKYNVLEIEEVTAKQIKDFFKELWQNGRKVTYTNGLLKAYRAFFKYVKVMDTFKTGVNFRISSSDNYEILTDYTDINGCDAWSMIATDDSRWKNIFYDFLTSVKNAPIYNTEDHIIVDARTMVYNDKEVLYNIADIWNGAVHGRGGSVLWLWDRSSRTKNGTIYFNSLITARPDTIATLGKTTLDLNRLSKEIVALQSAKSEIAVLYSNCSVPYNDEIHCMCLKIQMLRGWKSLFGSFIVNGHMNTLNLLKLKALRMVCSLMTEI